LAKFAHTMLRVLDEERSVSFYKTMFEMEIAERLDFDTFTLVYLSNAENSIELELTINKDQNGAYDLGNGYGHNAFVVDDIKAEHARFTVAGHTPRKIVEFNHQGSLLARFFFVKDPDGYDIEIIQRFGRFQ